MLFSNKKIFDEINKVYLELKRLEGGYSQQRNPESSEEDEEQISKYSVSKEFISKSIKNLVELMRKELKVKGKIKWVNDEHFS